MSIDLAFSCSCGAVRGVLRGVSPATVNRVVCSCSGCQRYARALGRDDELLDPYGGTDVVQASPASFELTQGRDLVACLRQTRKGALRWYASCCGTPIANTLAMSGVPFMGFLSGSFAGAVEEAKKDEVFGPVLARINGTYEPDVAKRLRATRWALVRMLFRFSWMLLRWRASGAHRHWAMDWQTPVERELRITGAVQ